MSIEKIEQTRKIAIYEITVAIKDPLFFGPLEGLDKALTIILDRIEKLLEGEWEE